MYPDWPQAHFTVEVEFLTLQPHIAQVLGLQTDTTEPCLFGLKGFMNVSQAAALPLELCIALGLCCFCFLFLWEVFNCPVACHSKNLEAFPAWFPVLSPACSSGVALSQIEDH